MQDERRKHYMDEYNKKKLEHFRTIKMLMNDETSIEVYKDTAGLRNPFGKKFTIKGPRCNRCEKLFLKAGQGDGIICSECVEEKTYGKRQYFSQAHRELY